MEEAIRHGGRQAFAMERGSGKSAIAERAAIWAALKGLHEFVLVVGATGSASAENMDAIKKELSSNALLLADFPELYPVWAIEDIAQKCRGQTLDGARTQLVWSRDVIVLPTIKR
jgi:hypothetical protein